MNPIDPRLYPRPPLTPRGRAFQAHWEAQANRLRDARILPLNLGPWAIRRFESFGPVAQGLTYDIAIKLLLGLQQENPDKRYVLYIPPQTTTPRGANISVLNPQGY